MPPLRKAILRTLAYADIFDYPLSASETSRFLIAKKKISLETVQKTLSQMTATGEQINAEKGFYCLKGRRELVGLRKKRARLSQKKLKIAQRVVSWLRLVPLIKMIAVTGTLAMDNSQEDDDLDLLIVTTKNRLWLTRLLTVLLIEVVASRRRPGDKKAKDKICLNMFLDEEHLGLPRKERDLFSAHEICQLKVLWEKDGIYQKFLKENQWVKQYLPNWKP
jgi:hypothetical protein